MKPFGYSLLLDCYKCKPCVGDDLDLCYRFLEELVDRLGMHKNGQPYVVHGPRTGGVELYPDKLGVSGFIALIESGIAIHSVEPKRFITLDVYSCGKFSQETVIDFARETFGFEAYEAQFLLRGNHYHVEAA